MPIEEEMQNEAVRLEREIDIIDKELEKLHSRIMQLMALRKKKDHDLHVLRYNFGQETDYEREFQTTLAKLLEEKI